MKYLVFSISLLFCLIARGEPPIQSGDRIAIVGNTFADQLRIHGYLETLLLQQKDVSIRNLGWGGDRLTSRDRPTNFPTEESTLSDHKADVIIACFGMGESFAGEEGLKDFESDLTAFVNSHQGKQYNGKSPVRLVLVSPIAYENRGKLTPFLEKRNRELKSYTRVIGSVASKAKIPFVDLYEPSRYLMNEMETAKLTTNGIHLNPFGYWALSHSFCEQLTGSSKESWRIFVDAKKLNGNATGVDVVDLKGDAQTVQFSVKEKSQPTLGPPTSSELPPQLASKRDTLVVSNLQVGEYSLFVDDTEVITASHEEWARGVAVDLSPAHLEANRLREAVNDKNTQFVYSWKALNQVHIVGERKRSPSGRALPEEVVAFNQLAIERDTGLRSMLQTKTRQWKLVPAKK